MKAKKEFLIRLTANVICFFALFFSPDASGKENTEIKTDSDQIFIAARFHYRGPHEYVSIVWSEPDSISVTIRLDINADDTSGFDRMWNVTADDSRQMRSLLSRVGGRPFRFGKDYVLDLCQPGGTIGHLSNLSAETELLQQIREGFEKIAHVHYTEAIAAFELGRKLSEKGRLKDAINVFGIGIGALGDRYLRPGVIDDSDLYLNFAEYYLRGNKLSDSVGLFDRVLESRIHSYRILFKPK